MPMAFVDMGHPLLNRIVNGVLKVGGVAALHAIFQETYKLYLRDETNNKSLQLKNMAQRTAKETIQWGLVAGVYAGMACAMRAARGTHDWKNALLAGALTGAAFSWSAEPFSHLLPGEGSQPRQDRRGGGSHSRKECREISGAITGGAIATAAEIIRNIT